MVSLSQAKANLAKAHGTDVASDQLYVCNLTNFPNQAGTTITVVFQAAGVTKYPQPGNCAYIQSNNGAPFSTQVSLKPTYVNYQWQYINARSGQMWEMTYNSANGSYPVMPMY